MTTNPLRLIMNPKMLGVLAAASLMVSCGGGGGGTPAAACTTFGSTVNLGGSVMGNYSASFGTSPAFGGVVGVSFNNSSLNFIGYANYANLKYIVDVGPVSCLESIGAWTGGTATAAAFTAGHGYILKYTNGVSTEYARFIAESYSNGIARITWAYP
jgi:hypothetical protein